MGSFLATVKNVTIITVCSLIVLDTGRSQSLEKAVYSSRFTLHPVSLSLAQHSQFANSLSSDSDTLTPTDAQLQPPNQVDYTRMAIVGAGLAAVIAGIHIYQQNGWWKDNRTSFHFREDLRYGLWVDKIGHFHGAAFAGFLGTKAFEWTNVSDETALWLGVGTGFLFQTYIEIEDGFSEWGFDRVDFSADVLGAAWPIARHYSPFLQNFDIKFSYHPSPLLNTASGTGFQGQQHLIFDDYEGQTMWFTARIHDILPRRARSFWPDFLGIALGYGARDISSKSAYPVVFVAFDYDMTRIIPTNTWFLRTLGQALNFIHFPSPTVRISPSAVWYGLYF